MKFRIELHRSLEGADRRRVVEPMQEGDALVEVALRFPRVGGDGHVVIPEAFVEGLVPGMGRGNTERDGCKSAAQRVRELMS
jgi:hypothetical protein